MKTKHLYYISLISLVLTLSAVSGIAVSADAQKVHALLICLGDDLKIRASVNVNEEKMTELLRQVSESCDVDLTIMKSVKAGRGVVTKMSFVNGSTVRDSDEKQGLITTDQVVQWLEKLRPKADDTLLVYYNGHGAVYGKTHMLHFDEVRQDLYNRNELKGMLAQKQARLKMLITDTCKNRVDTPPPNASTFAQVRAKNRRYTEHLFLQHKGMLDITAASTNQFALANDQIGGFFTAALIKSFSEEADMKRDGGIGNNDGFLSWQEVFAKCVWETQNLFSQSETQFNTALSKQLRKKNQTTQTPEQFSLPKRIGRSGGSGPGQNGTKFEDTLLQGHTKSIDSVSFSPDGKTIASGSLDKTVQLWDVSTGKLIRTLTRPTGEVRGVSFSSDGKTIASGNYDGVELWDVSTGKRIRTLTKHNTGWGVWCVSFSPDGKTIASGNYDGPIELWDVSTGKRIRTLTGHTAAVNGVSFSPDGKTIASGSRDEAILLWDVSTGELIRTLTTLTTWFSSVSFSPDGKTIASGGYDGVLLWDVNTGELIRTLTGHTHSVLSVSFSPDGKTIASGGKDNTVRLWDVSTGKRIRTLTGHTAAVESVSFSPDGKTIASGSWDGTVRLWKLAD